MEDGFVGEIGKMEEAQRKVDAKTEVKSVSIPSLKNLEILDKIRRLKSKIAAMKQVLSQNGEKAGTEFQAQQL